MPQLVVSDIHLGHQRDSELWHDIVIKLFQSIVDTCSKKNIDSLIVLGDLFNERKQIYIKTMHVAIQIMDLLKLLLN